MSPKTARKDLNPSKLSPSKMITRKQNVRHQRRIKNESILRISQITQMLKSPINCKYDYEPPKTPSIKVIKSPKKNKSISPPNIRNVSSMDLTEKNCTKKKCKLVIRKHVYYPTKSEDNAKAPIPMKTYMNKTVSNVTNNNQRQETETKPPKQVTKTVVTSKPDSEPTIEELIRLHENDDLSEEDLLEIITCPSPVWWENPPNEYSDTEDAISIYDEDIMKCITDVDTKSKIRETNSNNNNELKYNNTFITKRSKLENLLTNIKNKRNIIIDGEETIRKRRKGKCNINKLIRNKIAKETLCEEMKSDADVFFNLQNDVMLSNLENMKIPIQNKIIIEDEAKDKSESSDIEMVTVNSQNLIEHPKQSEKADSTDEMSLDEKNKRFKIMSIHSTDASPVSIKSISTENGTQEDAISDTNIKFIYEDSGSQNSITFENTDISETDNEVINSKTEKTFGLKIHNIEKNYAKSNNYNTGVNKKEVDKSNESKTVKINPDSEPKTFGLTILKDKTDVSQQKVKKSPKKFKMNADRKRHEIMTIYKIITGEQFNKNEMKSIAAKEKSIDNIEKIIKSNFVDTSNENKQIAADELNKTPIYLNKNHHDLKKNDDSNKLNKSEGLNKKRDDLNKILDDLTKNKNELNKSQVKTTTDDEQNSIQGSKSNVTKINDKNAKVDSFYKKLIKLINLKDLDKNDLEINFCSKCDPNQQKSIIIGNTKTKYCMKCSGIFETDECSYCSKISVNSSNFFTCQTCSLHFCCDVALSTHVKIHN